MICSKKLFCSRHVEDSEEDFPREKGEEEASTSGRDKEGVFIVFTDGEIALNGFYYNGQRNDFVGQKGQVLATSCHRGRLVVAALLETQTCEIAVYTSKVKPKHTRTKQIHAKRQSVRNACTLSSNKCLQLSWMSLVTTTRFGIL